MSVILHVKLYGASQVDGAKAFPIEDLDVFELFPGFQWKIWGGNADHGTGIYLFNTREEAEEYFPYVKKYAESLGYTDVTGTIYHVDILRSRATKAPIDVPTKTKGQIPANAKERLDEMLNRHS